MTEEASNGIDINCISSLELLVVNDESVALIVNNCQVFRHALGINTESSRIAAEKLAPIISRSALVDFFVHGKVSFMFGILSRLHETLAKLRRDHKEGSPLPTVELQLAEVLKEISEYLGGQT